MQANSKSVTCFRCSAEHTEAHYDRVVHNKTPLYGPWAGWRMAGRDLVSPHGDRINPQRLARILWAERARARGLTKAGYAKCPESIPILPARERFSESA